MKNDLKDSEKINPESSSQETGKTNEAEADQNHDVKKTSYILPGLVGLLILVFLLVGSFVMFRASRRFSPVINSISFSRNYGHMGFRNGGFMGRMMNVNSISGKVTSVNGQTFTIDDNGQSKSVQISDTTKFPVNSATKVNVGDQVDIWGLQNSSGVIQADRISINP